MASLIQPLVFVDKDKNGKRLDVEYPAGTPLHECRIAAGSQWFSELRACEGTLDRKRRDKVEAKIWIMDGRPTVIDRRFFDAEYAEKQKQVDRMMALSFAAELQGHSYGGPEGSAAPIWPVPGETCGSGETSVDGLIDVPPVPVSVNHISEVEQTTSTAVMAETVPAPTCESEPSGGTSVSGWTDSPPVLGSVPYDQYGLVVIVDYMNLLVKAWHAGAPSKIHAVKSLLLTVANIIERLSPEYIIFAADGGHAERSALYPAYKAHRPPKPPELVEQIELGKRAIQAIGWPMIRVNDWEADDVIASLATQVANRAAGCLVCSCDKDLFQLLDGSLRVKIYHPWDQGKHLSGSHVEEKYGVKRHQFSEYLALVGDASDGVPGVTGIGPKKAAELLGKYEDLEQILEEARLLKIIGSAGKQLREQADQARLSAKLIELNCEIPIPNSWHDFPATSPAAGWVDALRAIDLGAVVQRLGELLPMVGRVRLCSSFIEVIHDSEKAAKSPPALRRDLGNDPETHSGDSDPERRPRASAACPAHPVETSSFGGCDVPGGELREKLGQGVEFLSGGIPARPNQGDADSRDEFAWALDFPPFLNLRPNLGRETCLRAVYADAYRFFLRGECPPNQQIFDDYKQAWDLGITGQIFVLPPRARLLTGDTAEDPPAPPYVIPQRRHIERNPQPESRSPADSRGKSTLF